MNDSTESPDRKRSMTVRPAPPPNTRAKRELLAFLEDHTAPLLGTIRVYVQRLGLAHGDNVRAVALDVFQEAATEALAHAERFSPGREPRAWLLGIAVNVIRRKKAEQIRRSQRELSFQQVFPTFDDSLEAAGAQGQRFSQPATEAADLSLEASERAEDLLALVSADDSQVLRLAILEDFDSDALAARLGVGTGAARMRLHRALNRLRLACGERHPALDGERETRDA